MPAKHLEFLGDGASRCIINSGERSVSKQRCAYLNTRSRGSGRAGEQTQPRQPVLWEGLPPGHVIFGVGVRSGTVSGELDSGRVSPQETGLVWTTPEGHWSVTGALRMEISPHGQAVPP